MKEQKTAKRLLCLCLALLMALSLAACGGQADENSTPPTVSTQPTIKPTEAVSPTPTPAIPFTDVPEDSNYYNAVKWAYENGITSGDSLFEPLSACTRGQVITFIWRAMGSPEPQITENPISDISSADWYYKPVLWAYENGISSSTTFNPGNPCSNGEAITFLWRAKGKPIALAASDAYYARPVAWADQGGLLTELESGFDPASPCLRADFIAYLYWATEQWTFTEEDKTIQAEYEQIISDAEYYKVHGSGLCYADYVDVEGDGKIELLTVGLSGSNATATVYANIDGHVGKFSEGTFDTYGEDGFSTCRADGQLYLCHGVFSGNLGETYDFYKIENGSIVHNEQATVFYRESTSESDTAILQKYTDDKTLFTITYNGVDIPNRGLLPDPSAVMEEIYAAVKNGDFSFFAGTYTPHEQFVEGGYLVTPISLNENGVLTDGVHYAGTKPISITIIESGAIVCVVWEGEPIGNGGLHLGETYLILPPGVSSSYDYMDYDELGTDKIRIRYIYVDGGISDIMYFKD